MAIFNSSQAFRRLLITLCFAAGNATLFAQLPAAITTRLDKVFYRFCHKHALQGASACIIVPHKGAWTAVYGESYPGRPVRKDMLMGISSNTKTFIAATILIMQEQHLLQLDDTIGKWIGAGKGISGKITVRQLLNHTSGIADFTDHPHFMDSLKADPNRIWKKEALLSLVDTPVFKAGTGWAYSNSNYVLAGIIIEQVMGKPVEAVLQDVLFGPQKLSSSFYYPQQQPGGEMAHQWTSHMAGKTIDLTSTHSLAALFSMASCAGAIVQTAEDNATFWYRLVAGKILNESSMREMMVFVDAEDGESYGLGLFRYGGGSALNGRTGYGHGGTNFGFVSQSFVDSSSDICFSVLTNQDKVEEDALLNTLIRKLLVVLSEL